MLLGIFAFYVLILPMVPFPASTVWMSGMSSMTPVYLNARYYLDVNTGVLCGTINRDIYWEYPTSPLDALNICKLAIHLNQAQGKAENGRKNSL